MRHRRIVLIASLLACGLTLSGCETFDPTEWFNTKKKLVGERKAVFPEGVPGVPQGVPPEMVKGYQPPPEAPPPVIEAKPEKKAKPKKVAAKPHPQQPQQPQQQQPAARTTTQPAGQSASQQTMPGAQPTWPANAPPAPGPWAGPQR